MDQPVERLFTNATKWRAEADALRKILVGCRLTEELKWRKACYSFDGNNIAIIQRMNDHLALMFFKGALLEDPQGHLKEQGPNSRSARRLEFTSVPDVTKRARVIQGFVKAAIEVEKAGLKVKKAPKLALVEELVERMKREPKLKAAFEALTPGRQRAYNLHFSAAKQSSTRERRIENYAAQILRGRGLRD